MAIRILPDAEFLRQIFSYDPKTGEIRHKTRPHALFAREQAFKTWHIRYSGKVATSNYKGGYLAVGIWNVKYAAHRLAYKMHFGIDPPEDIDHINGVRTDNRIDNLRCATRAQNLWNSKKTSRNTSGQVGVHFHAATQRYRASICKNGQETFLGCFDLFEEAKSAYLQKALELHGEFSRESRPALSNAPLENGKEPHRCI